jgi:SAM-dependent methyltransferase
LKDRCGPKASWLDWLEEFEGHLERDGGESWREAIASRVVNGAHLRLGDAVVDLGAGTGLLSLPAGGAVGRSGTVTAVDADEGCLAALAAAAREAGLSNIRTVHSHIEQLPFDDRTFGAALCRSSIVYSADVSRPVSEMWRTLVEGGRFSVFEPLLGEWTWEAVGGVVGTDFSEMESALKESGGPRSIDRGALRSAFARSGFEFETLVVHYGLGMKGQPVERLVGEYLFDLPGELSAFNILKKGGFAEERIMELAGEFARGAAAGLIRGRLPCIFAWGAKTSG